MNQYQGKDRRSNLNQPTPPTGSKETNLPELKPKTRPIYRLCRTRKREAAGNRFIFGHKAEKGITFSIPFRFNPSAPPSLSLSLPPLSWRWIETGLRIQAPLFPFYSKQRRGRLSSSFLSFNLCSVFI